jgi:hypothetical protein
MIGNRGNQFDSECCSVDSWLEFSQLHEANISFQYKVIFHSIQNYSSAWLIDVALCLLGVQCCCCSMWHMVCLEFSDLSVAPKPENISIPENSLIPEKISIPENYCMK